MRFLILLFLLLFCFGSPTFAKGSASTPTLTVPAVDVTASEMDRLIGTMEDPAAREQFLNNLRSLRDAQRQIEQSKKKESSLGELLLQALSAKVEEASNLVGKLIGEILQIPIWLQQLGETAMDQAARQHGLEILIKLAGILGLAWLAQKLAERLLRGPRLALEMRARPSLPMRLAFSCLHFFFDLIPLAVFGLSAQLILPLTYPATTVKLAALAIVNARLLARGLNLLGETILMPHAPNLRVTHFQNRRAVQLMVWWQRFVNIIVYSYFFFGLGDLLELPPGLLSLLQQAIGLAIAIMALSLVMQNRHKIASSIKSGDTPLSTWISLRNRIAETWHIFAFLYIFALYGIWALGLPGGFQFLIRATLVTVVVMAVTRLAIELMSRAIDRSFNLSKDLHDHLPGLEHRVSRYLPVFLWMGRTAIYALAIFLIAEAWGIDVVGFLSSSAGKRIGDAIGSIVVVLAIAVLTWETMNTVIDHWLAHNGHTGHERRQRLKTLLPLLRNAMRITIFIMVSLIILSQIGINIAPLLAGAGVIGLAIGFGAQTLVKDIITGLFIIAEDAIAIGDVVEIDKHEGKVEGMTIRTLRLRDDEGAVHTLPYSFIEAIRNKSKDFSNVIVEVPFKHAADYDQLVKVLQQIGQELKAGEWGKYLLSDLQIQGVSRTADGNTTLRARLKVKPGRQRVVNRAFNLLLKNKLDEGDIKK